MDDLAPGRHLLSSSLGYKRGRLLFWKAWHVWETLRECQQGQDEVDGHKELDCSLTDRLHRLTGYSEVITSRARALIEQEVED